MLLSYPRSALIEWRPVTGGWASCLRTDHRKNLCVSMASFSPVNAGRSSSIGAGAHTTVHDVTITQRRPAKAIRERPPADTSHKIARNATQRYHVFFAPRVCEGGSSFAVRTNRAHLVVPCPSPTCRCDEFSDRFCFTASANFMVCERVSLVCGCWYFVSPLLDVAVVAGDTPLKSFLILFL